MLKPEQIDRAKQLTSSHNGKPLDQKALLQPNPLVGKILLARFMSMTPQQQQSLKAILTPQTADALKVLLPEASKIFERGLNNAG